MSRPLRIQYSGAVYHVMNRGAARQNIFIDKADYHIFLDVLEEAHRKWNFEVYAYCLMGNHYHLCLKTPEPKLARIMRHLNGVYTQRFNKKHGRDGSLFRGRYKAMLIEEDEYLSQVVRYIHLNPIEARLVKRPEDYLWCSHQYYLNKKAPVWLNRERVMAWFGKPLFFHKHVLEGNERTIKSIYQGNRWPVILGSETFIEQLQLRDEKLSKEHVREERQFLRPSMEQILDAVSKEFRVSMTQLTVGQRGQSNMARKVAFWALKELGDYTHSQLAKNFGLSPGTCGWACQQIRAEVKKNSKLRKKLTTIQNQISQQKT